MHSSRGDTARPHTTHIGRPVRGDASASRMLSISGTITLRRLGRVAAETVICR